MCTEMIAYGAPDAALRLFSKHFNLFPYCRLYANACLDGFDWCDCVQAMRELTNEKKKPTAKRSENICENIYTNARIAKIALQSMIAKSKCTTITVSQLSTNEEKKLFAFSVQPLFFLIFSAWHIITNDLSRFITLHA